MQLLEKTALSQVHGGYLEYYSASDIQSERIGNAIGGGLVGGVIGAALSQAKGPNNPAAVVGGLLGAWVGGSLAYNFCEAASMTPGWYDVTYTYDVYYYYY